MDYCSSQGVFPPYARCSWDRLWIFHDPDQDKAHTKSVRNVWFTITTDKVTHRYDKTLAGM